MPQPTKTQKTAFKELQKIDPNLEVRSDTKTGALGRGRVEPFRVPKPARQRRSPGSF